MARKKTSPAEDLMDLIAKLPWWGGLLLAVVSYGVLHRLAVPVSTTGLQPGQIQSFVMASMLTALAGIGQYLLPLICILGAIVSFVQRKKRRGLMDVAAQPKGAGAVDGMTWREFEVLVGESFRRQGYQVLETGGSGPDGGIDLVLSRGDERFLVQCKHWKAYKVGVDVVRELYGVMAAKGAAGGFVVTSGTFTEDAKGFADGRNVTLVNGQRLMGMIRQVKSSKAAAERSIELPRAAPIAAPSSPQCPVCATAMVWRTAKKGANAGSHFWGCVKYPVCRGTLPAN